MKYSVTVNKNDQFYHFFQCPECGKPDHKITYKYKPITCPGHQFEFIGTEFQDNPHSHEINHIFRCDRCGAIYKKARTVKEAGLLGHVDVDDPRVKKTLLFNDAVAKRIDKDLGAIVTEKEPLIPKEEEA